VITALNLVGKVLSDDYWVTSWDYWNLVKRASDPAVRHTIERSGIVAGGAHASRLASGTVARILPPRGWNHRGSLVRVSMARGSRYLPRCGAAKTLPGCLFRVIYGLFLYGLTVLAYDVVDALRSVVLSLSRLRAFLPSGFEEDVRDVVQERKPIQVDDDRRSARRSPHLLPECLLRTQVVNSPRLTEGDHPETLQRPLEESHPINHVPTPRGSTNT